MIVEDRLQELGITLPDTPAPLGNYLTAVQTGNLLFISGHTSTKPNREVRGKLGAGVGLDQGNAAARSVAIDILATIKAAAGDLGRVARIVKVNGMVNATPDFVDHPKVINGASDLFVAVFGDKGKHARAAVGMSSLPGDAAVEIEAVVELT